ncbi:MAG: hypothetical protein SV422_02515 [Pseudomonadota bacterium]|nr:hypothetical protein [Pseudomonadota bacterium]
MKRMGTLIAICSLLGAGTVQAQPAPAYTGFDHVELGVADLPRARDFYAKLFGTGIWKDTSSEQRYLQLGQSHLALDVQGDAQVDHVGFGVENFDMTAAQRWLAAQSIPWLDTAVSGELIVADRDGIRSQVAPDDTWEQVSGTRARREANDEAAAPIFTAYAIDEVFLTVRNLEVDSLFYSRLLDQTGTLQAGSLWYQVGQASRLRLTQAPVGQTPGVAYFAVHVAYTDMEAAAEAVFAAGGIIENILPNGFSFWDPDGIRIVVRSGDLY